MTWWMITKLKERAQRFCRDVLWVHPLRTEWWSCWIEMFYISIWCQKPSLKKQPTKQKTYPFLIQNTVLRLMGVWHLSLSIPNGFWSGGKWDRNIILSDSNKVLNDWVLGRLGKSIAESLTVSCNMNEA